MPDSLGTKATAATSLCPSAVGAERVGGDRGALDAAAAPCPGAASQWRSAPARRRSWRRRAASTTPSGSAVPSSSRPAQVVSTTSPSPAMRRTSFAGGVADLNGPGGGLRDGEPDGGLVAHAVAVRADGRVADDEAVDLGLPGARDDLAHVRQLRVQATAGTVRVVGVAVPGDRRERHPLAGRELLAVAADRGSPCPADRRDGRPASTRAGVRAT